MQPAKMIAKLEMTTVKALQNKDQIQNQTKPCSIPLHILVATNRGTSRNNGTLIAHTKVFLLNVSLEERSTLKCKN